jgi:succinoglycan biosynthesis transport protein ExoP
MRAPAQAESIRAALRRSRALIVVFVLLGVVMSNASMQLRGPKYRATSEVLLTTTDIGTVVTEGQPIVDPERVDETGLAYAESSELYSRTAEQNPGLGTAEEIQDITEVAVSDSVLDFRVTTDEEDPAVQTANALAIEYVEWRKEIEGAEIVQGIAQLQRQLANEPAGSQRHQDLRAQLNDLEFLNKLNTGHARVIETASEAQKISPAPVRDSLLGAALGLLVALAVAGIREALDTRVRSEEDVEEVLDVPVLATVPSLPRRSRLVMFSRHEQLFGDTYGLLGAALTHGRGGGTLVIGVTSAIATEGKTTTAANLAVALARRGENVVLADFDVRRPSVGPLFNLPLNAEGVAQILAGQTTIERAMWEVSLNGRGPNPNLIAPTGMDGNGARAAPGAGSLRVLPAGGHFGSMDHVKNLSRVVEDLRRTADVILLDTPPAVLAVEMSELARTIDRIVVVVRQGRATRRSLQALSRQAQSWPADVVGAVLTDAQVEERTYYYGTR